MKRKIYRLLRTAALLCMMAVLLCGTASANSLPPEYMVLVKVANRPEEPYYLDLLVPENTNGGSYSGPKQESPEHPLDKQMLETLASAVPDGWTAFGGCESWHQRSNGGYWYDLSGKNGTHQFEGWHTDVFRILIVTKSGETWVSDQMDRRVVQDAVRVDWAAKRVSMPPVWLAVVLQTLSTLLPTLAIEGLVLLAFRFSWKRNWKPFLAVNLATQGALAVFLSLKIVQYGAYYAIVFFGAIVLIPIELVIAFVEAYQYSRRLQGQSERRAFAYGFTANAASYLLGLKLVPLAWTGVVRALWMGI